MKKTFDKKSAFVQISALFQFYITDIVQTSAPFAKRERNDVTKREKRDIEERNNARMRNDPTKMRDTPWREMLGTNREK